MESLAAPPAQFPSTIWRQLTSVDARLLDELAYLIRRQAARSSTGARYCVPGRRYLARKLGCSVETVSRHVSKLRRLGIVIAFQRRPKAGVWQTNLYRIVHWIGWRAARLRHLVAGVADRVSRMAHIAPSWKGKNNRSQSVGPPARQKEQLPELLERWRRKGLLPPS